MQNLGFFMCSLHIGYIGVLYAVAALGAFIQRWSSNRLINAANKVQLLGLAHTSSPCNLKASLWFLFTGLPHIMAAAIFTWQPKSSRASIPANKVAAAWSFMTQPWNSHIPCRVFCVLLIEIITEVHLVSLERRYRPSPIGSLKNLHFLFILFFKVKKKSLLLLSLRYAC